MVNNDETYCWWFRNPVNSPVEVGSLSYYLQGFIHPQVGCLGFLNHQQYVSSSTSPPKKNPSSTLWTPQNLDTNNPNRKEIPLPNLHFVLFYLSFLDPSFAWKKPCFEGLTFKNRGHWGSRYILSYICLICTSSSFNLFPFSTWPYYHGDNSLSTGVKNWL